MDETHPCCIIYSKYQPPVLSVFTDVGYFYVLDERERTLQLLRIFT